MDRRIKRGSIRRVRMRNFLTYDDCEVFPGPKLNVVIGPNGSGKSSLTHAICLACVGGTEDIGRTNQLSFFVKLGTPIDQPTFVEVDLYETADRYITIRRVLNGADNSSIWYINGAKKKLSEVKALIRSLAIDVDNLCSFMPQDRVGAFSNYNGKEILQNTLKSIRSPTEEQNLFEEQTQLSDLEKLRETCRKERDDYQRQFDDARRELNSLQTELARLERRKEALVKLKLLKVKLTFVECQNAKTAFDERNAAVTEIEEEITRKKKLLQPLQQEIARFQKALEKLQRSSGNSSSSSSSSSAAAKVSSANVAAKTKSLIDQMSHIQGDISSKDDDIDTASAELNIVEVKRIEEEKKLDKINREIAQNNQRLALIEAELPDLEAQNKTHSDQIAALTTRSKELDNQRIDLQRAVQDKQGEIAQQTRKLENLKDARQLYRQRLASQNHFQNPGAQDVIKVMDWLDNNLQAWKDSGRFRGNIHGPVGMLISVQDPAYGAMVEKVVNVTRLSSFLVENEHDFTEFRRVLSDHLRVRVNTYNVENMSVLRQSRIFSASQLEQFHRLGVVGYLSEQLHCSDVVRAFLYSFAGIQNTLCGKSDVDKLSDNDFNQLCANPSHGFHLLLQLSREAPNNNNNRRMSGGYNRNNNNNNANAQYQGVIMDYSGRKSRYNPTGVPTISSGSIPPGKGLVTGYADNNGNMDDDNQEDAENLGDIQTQRRRLEETIHTAQQTIRNLQTQLNQISQEKNQLDTDKGVLQKVRSDFLLKKNEPANLKRKLLQLKQQQDHINKQLSGDVEQQKAKIRKQYVAAMDKLLSSLTSALTHMDTCLQHLPVKSASGMKKSALEEMLAKHQQKLEEESESLRLCEKKFDRLKAEAKSYLQMFRAKESALEELMMEEGDADKFMNEVFPLAQQVCATDNAQEIENLIIETDAEVNSIVDNPGLIQRQQTLTRQLQEAQTKLDKSNNEHDQAEASLEARKGRWIDSVQALQQKLHTVFQAYMRELNFDGEILLRPQGTFLDYELILMVKFRLEGQLSALSAQKHSGGERAVSTIMFLMALQDMTQSPFRVVDEINQGMDERNERLVFDRIVRNCCGEFANTTITANNNANHTNNTNTNSSSNATASSAAVKSLTKKPATSSNRSKLTTNTTASAKRRLNNNNNHNDDDDDADDDEEEDYDYGDSQANEDATASNTTNKNLKDKITPFHYIPQWRPQYFLITPKLLPNLVSLRHPDVTVLLVRSGAGLRDTNWDFNHIANQYLSRIGGAALPLRSSLTVATNTTANANAHTSSNSNSNSNSSSHNANSSSNASTANKVLTNKTTTAATTSGSTVKQEAAFATTPASAAGRGTKRGLSAVVASTSAHSSSTSNSNTTGNNVDLWAVKKEILDGKVSSSAVKKTVVAEEDEGGVIDLSMDDIDVSDLQQPHGHNNNDNVENEAASVVNKRMRTASTTHSSSSGGGRVVKNETSLASIFTASPATAGAAGTASAAAIAAAGSSRGRRHVHTQPTDTEVIDLT